MKITVGMQSPIPLLEWERGFRGSTQQAAKQPRHVDMTLFVFVDPFARG